MILVFVDSRISWEILSGVWKMEGSSRGIAYLVRGFWIKININREIIDLILIIRKEKGIISILVKYSIDLKLISCKYKKE